MVAVGLPLATRTAIGSILWIRLKGQTAFFSFGVFDGGREQNLPQVFSWVDAVTVKATTCLYTPNI